MTKKNYKFYFEKLSRLILYMETLSYLEVNCKIFKA